MVIIPITLNEIHCDANNEVWLLFEVQHLTKQMWYIVLRLSSRAVTHDLVALIEFINLFCDNV